MKKLKRYACGVFIIVFALVLAFGSGCGEFLSILVAVDGAVNTTTGEKAEPTIKDAADSLESYWGITLPDDACLSCGVYNLGWMGDGEIYYVIGFEDEPADMLSHFNQGVDTDFEKYFKNYLNKISEQSQTGIAEKYLPQWSAVYKYALCSDEKGNNLYAMYCPQALNLYAVLLVNT